MQKLTAMIALILLHSCSKEMPTKHTPIYPVHAAKVVKKDMPIYLETIGNVDPVLHVNITSRIQGEITGVYFTEGKEIKPGDLLFTIDPRTFQAAVQKAEGVLQENIAKLDIAREKVLRFSPLTEEDYYAKINFDQLKSNLHAMEGSLLQAKASLESAKVELGYCWIYSPLEGRAGILQVDQGNIVKGDDSHTLVTINQIKPIYVTFFFPENDLAQIRRSQQRCGRLQTIVSRDGFHKDAIYGSLEMIDNAVDQETGTITLRALFPNTNEELWPGKYVQVRLVLYVQKDALVIPYSAINYDAKGPFAFIISNEQTIIKRYLTLGNRFDEEIIIQKGVRPSEHVVTLGAQNLFTGARVSIKGEKLQ